MPLLVANTRPAQQKTTALVAVSYDRAMSSASHRLLAASEARAGGTFRSEYDFPHLNKTTRVLAVAVAQLARTEAALRAQPGVRSVALTGGRRYALTVNVPYYTSDPYFEGFNQTQTGNDAATFEQQPLVENANVPGQWGAHKTQLEYAFGYSQPGNGSNITNRAALGSSSIKIAIIDTGADLTQPDLAPKVTLQRCFITNENGTAQSTSNFVTDPDGHGTNVSGIAGAASNNGFGFTGEGGASVLYEYRVNPTPDAGCFSDPVSSSDNTCGADTADVSAAINDAVSRGVNVISMSLGGGDCTNGVDADPIEADAVANAIASNVVVVAAAGNGGTTSDTKVTSPGCDTGVIAVGASALADGAPNGTGTSSGSSVNPIEYVASYSSYGSPSSSFGNTNAWGIVAPGGDPSDSSDGDQLHWINNLYTSTSTDPSADPANYCGVDYGTIRPAAECQLLIAGTSMSTPVVAGAAALILAVNPSYHVPALMKQLLCQTSEDIGDAKEGCGRLNIYRAMARALGDTIPPAARFRKP